MGRLSGNGRSVGARFRAASSSTITAAYLTVGMLYDRSTAYHGRLFCDWVHKV